MGGFFWARGGGNRKWWNGVAAKRLKRRKNLDFAGVGACQFFAVPPFYQEVCRLENAGFSARNNHAGDTGKKRGIRIPAN